MNSSRKLCPNSNFLGGENQDFLFLNLSNQVYLALLPVASKILWVEPSEIGGEHQKAQKPINNFAQKADLCGSQMTLFNRNL